MKSDLNQLQADLISIWKNILRIEDVSVKDDFFDLGGQSLAAINMIVELSQRHHVDIDFETFALNPTIEELCSLIANKR